MLRWLTAGESHGPALVAVLEGLPAHVSVTSEDIVDALARRRLGYGRGARMSFEQDEIEIVGGIRHGVSQGSPVAVLAALAAWSEGDVGLLVGAGLGWLVAGGTFFLLWFIYPRGMGYGDVRLSGVLGIALGYLGWGELLVGVYAGFVVGAVGGLGLSLLRIVDRKAYPFGPFMLIGAVVGVVLGPHVGAWYA